MTTSVKLSVVEQTGFHGQEIAGFVLTPQGQPTSHPDAKFTYTFETFFHPFVGELIATLNHGTLADMLNPETLHKLKDTSFFKDFYLPNPDGSPTVDIPDSSLPEKRIDVSSAGPYANYNWEMLFHLPLNVAVHLSKNQRFAEARRWFHLIFDPTCTDDLPPLQRFWKFLAFRYPDKPGTPTRLDDLLLLLSKPPGELTQTEVAQKNDILNGYHGI